MLWKKFNDQIALLILFLFVGIWVADVVIPATCNLQMGFSEGVMGATISLVTLIVQYYFRRKDPDNAGSREEAGREQGAGNRE